MILKIPAKRTAKFLIYLADDLRQLKGDNTLPPEVFDYFSEQLNHGGQSAFINILGGGYQVSLVQGASASEKSEQLRRTAAQVATQLNLQKVSNVYLVNKSIHPDAAYQFAEGLALSSYKFLKYFSDSKKRENLFRTIEFDKGAITVKEMQHLSVVLEAVTIARDLVNEPLNALGAKELASKISALGKQAGFKTKVLSKTEIVREKMGGILAVNRGSIHGSTFSIMEHKPAKCLNKQPIVLVGKGVVYDTGGLSLKPTPNSMDRMKSDMSGAAVVAAALYAIAKLKLPLHIIGLVPATDNRPGEDAYVPGDVIRMYSGKTVEVLNTDAEGRMILADALHWATRYKPELVIDFATLTGAAAAITGAEAMVMMGNATETVKSAFMEAGSRQHERMVELPLWKEYNDMIQSEIADLKNVGGPYGGAITAGKFLEHFTTYPWIHCDIAGVSFNTAKAHYKPAGGTGFGIRALLDFLSHYGK
jgi:leucyl aminopeptidase